MVLDLDLNDHPGVEGLLVIDDAIGVNTNLELGLPQLQVTADSDSMDDDVMICSPRSFAEAREKSRRNPPVIVVDEETETQGPSAEGLLMLGAASSRQSRASKRNKKSVLCINLETPEKCEKNADKPQQKSQPAAAQPKKPAFCCPICWGQFVEETSTKCGHIFCKKCITTAIATQGKCPTCRKVLKDKDTFRVYLPTSN